MRFSLRLAFLAGVGLAAVPAHAQVNLAQVNLAQLDISPPGVRQAPAVRAAPQRPLVRAPRSAPLPEPRPAEAGESEAGHELATAPPAGEPPPAAAGPATPASPPAPDTAAAPPAATAPSPSGEASSPFDDAFRAAEAARSRAPAIPEGHPAIVNAPLPPGRPGDTAPATPPAAPPAVEARAAVGAVDPPRLEAPFAEAPPRRFEGRAFSEKRYPVGRASHFPTLRRLAEEMRVPIDLADVVATVESAYDPHAVGLADEIGLMQVRPAEARQLGFQGSIQDLFEPETNIRLGMTYLAGAWERSGGDLCRALMKYRTGWEETEMSALSLEYCRRAVVHLAAIGSPLARGIEPPRGPAAPPPGQPSRSQFNWSDHEERIKQIEQRFGGQNYGIIAGEPRRP